MDSPILRLRGLSKVFPGAGGKPALTAVAPLDLDLRPGEFFTFLGPSGCGKTTLLRMIAGFEAPSGGSIQIAGRSMVGVPPHRRPVNLVFQSYALFPHLTVAENVGFPLKMQGLPAAEAGDRVAEALAMVQLQGLEARLPAQLSGGQQQRVALARALVGRPALLLLDEPLGALDLKLRKTMQLELKRLQGRLGMTFVYITHDQEEALTLSDRIAVMRSGVVEQLGRPRDIYERPRSRFVADFIGESNFLSGRLLGVAEGRAVVAAVTGQTLRTDIADLADTLGVRAWSEPAQPAVDRAVTLTLRPEQVNLSPDAEGPAADAGLSGTLEAVVYLGTDLRYLVRLDGADPAPTWMVRVPNDGDHLDPRLQVGGRVRLSWRPEDLRLLLD